MPKKLDDGSIYYQGATFHAYEWPETLVLDNDRPSMKLPPFTLPPWANDLKVTVSVAMDSPFPVERIVSNHEPLGSIVQLTAPSKIQMGEGRTELEYIPVKIDEVKIEYVIKEASDEPAEDM